MGPTIIVIILVAIAISDIHLSAKRRKQILKH